MTGPDSNYQQNPQQPHWESGPLAGQYPTGGPYASGAQPGSGAQYPSAQPGSSGPYPAGQPGSSGPYPTGGQYPTAGQVTSGGYAGNQFPAGQYGNYPTANPYSAAPAPPGQAYRPGQAWDPVGAQRETFAGGLPAGAGGFAGNQPKGAAGGPPRSAGRRRVAPAKLFGLAIAALGGLNFIFGFLPEVSAARSGATLSVFAVGPAYVPILLLIAGLLALAAFLPGSERSRLAVAAVSVGGAAGAIVSLGTPGSFELFANPNQVSSGLGAILLVIFGIVQAVIAVGAYVVGADTPWRSRSDPERADPAVAPGRPAAWDAQGSAGASGSIDPSLVGVYPSERARDVGGPYPGRGGSAWPADHAQQGWVGPPASSGYPQSPGYGAAGQTVTSATDGAMSPSRSVQVEEPVTGPQVVVGTETARVDTRKFAEAAPSDADRPSAPQGEGGEPLGAAVSGSAVDLVRESSEARRDPAAGAVRSDNGAIWSADGAVSSDDGAVGPAAGPGIRDSAVNDDPPTDQAPSGRPS